MAAALRPRLDVLPAAQRRLWPVLQPTVAMGWVLYGGTAIALRLGHRVSVDFDFFSDQALDRSALYRALPALTAATVLQDREQTLTVSMPPTAVDDAPVKLSFFGGLTFGRVGEPQVTDDGAAAVASADDLMVTKLKVLLQRAEAKDYRDIGGLLRAGVSLARGLAAARAMFGPQFQPSEALKALGYFADGDLPTLGDSDRRVLVDAVRRVGDLPAVDVLSRALGVDSDYRFR